MRILSTLFLFTLLALTAQAQQAVAPLLPLTVPESDLNTIIGEPVALTPFSIAEEEDSNLFYFDTNLPAAVRQFPMNLGGGATLIIISERFTSPGVNTILDSVRIFFPTIATGDIKLMIMRDTLLSIGQPQPFHFPNLGPKYAILDTFQIVREDVERNSNHSVAFPAIPVPDEWHVVFQPVDRGDILPAFTLAMTMDSVMTSTITPEKGRMTFFYVTADDGASGIYIEGTSAQGYSYLPNLIMSASVRYGGATGIGDVADVKSMRIDGLYPHPVSSATGSPTMAFSLDRAQNVHIAVYDVMGRRVSSAVRAFMPAGNQLINLPVAGVMPGTYMVRMQGETSVASKTMIVVE